MSDVIPPVLPIVKYNPNHDYRGRFSNAPDAGAPASDAQWNVQANDPNADDRGTPATITSTPMDDEGYARHLKHVEEELTLAEHTGMPDTMHQFDMKAGVEGKYSAERQTLHNQIIFDVMQRAKATVPREMRAIITAGLGGSGKSTSLRKNARDPKSVAGLLGIKYASYDADGNGVGEPTNFVTLNPDDLKEEFAQRNMIPKVDHLSPMESSTFAHEEASWLSKEIGKRVMAKGYNVIWDITMPSVKAGEKKARPLQIEGYDIDLVTIDVPIKQSQDSAAFRHRKGQDQWNQGNGHGGRYVPARLQAESVDPTGEFNSKNVAAAEVLTRKGVFAHTILVDNTRGPDGKYAGRIVRTTGFDHDVDTVTKQGPGPDDDKSMWSDRDYYVSPLVSDEPGSISRSCLDYREGRLTFDQLCHILGGRSYAPLNRSQSDDRRIDSWEEDDLVTPGSWDEVTLAVATGLLTQHEADVIGELALAHNGH